MSLRITVKIIKSSIRESIKQFLIKKGCFLNRRLNDSLNKFKSFKYSTMISHGLEIDFGKLSMFSYNDPLIIMFNYLKGTISLNRKYKEKILYENLNNLVKYNKSEMRPLKLNIFSGLSAANCFKDWETLSEYGKSFTLIRNIESKENFEKLKDEIFNSVKRANYYMWTNRYYFINYDFSHRLAGLHNKDIIRNKNTIIDLDLTEWSLNIDCAKIIYENYFGIVTTSKTYSVLVQQLKKNYIEILFEETNLKEKDLYILWIEKSKNRFLSGIINFIETLPSNQCYIISIFLEKYINEMQSN